MNIKKEIEDRQTMITDTVLIINAMRSLPSDELRQAVMNEFCKHCGSNNPRCQCWNDE